MTCPHCESTVVRRRKQRTALGYRRFACADCQRRFNERTGTPFNELQFPTDIVLLAVLWRLRYRFCQNSGLIDDGVAIHAGVHHAALTFSINSRHREMNTCRRAANDAGVLSILK